MRSTSAFLFLTLSGLALLGVSRANAQITLEQSYSGSAVPTGVDIDGDGGSVALTSVVGGHSNFGDFTATSVSELATDPVKNERCPRGQLEFPSVSFSAVERFASGELLYLELDPVLGGVTCVDVETGGAASRIHFVVAGGTGRLAGAIGSLVLRGTGENLTVDTEGGVVLAAVFGSLAGTIELED